MKKLRFAGLLSILLAMSVSGIWVQAQDDFALDAAFGVRVIRNLTESYVNGLIESMHVMTRAADLRTGDWDQMKGLLAQFEESEMSYNAWFLKPDGSYYKVESGLASANLSDRDYFARVMAGETTLGDLLVSRSTGRKSMILTAPIMNGPSVIGALGVTLYLDDFCALIHDKLRLPSGIGFYAYDESSVISMHVDPALLLEPLAASGISLASGGIDISDLLGWTFLLGTVE